MKKNKFIVFYSILASLAILFALGFLGFNIYNEYNHGYERTKRRFDHLTNTIQKSFSKEYSSKKDFNNEIQKNIGDISDFSFLQITENGNVIFIYPDVNSTSDNSSNLIKNFYGYFDCAGNSYYITANLYILRPSSIYYYSKIAFLIILITTLITAVFIIVLNTKTSSDVKSEIIEEEVHNDFSDDLSISDSKENSIEAEENTSEEKGSSEEENVFENSFDSITSETSSEKKVELPYQEFTPAKVQVLESENTDNPSGLFSPETGIGWESYLLTRLDNELNRAIASEFDLALFIIKIPGVLRNNPKLHEVCDYLTAQFQFKDLLFEYKDDCIVAIKVNTNLDDALILADKLYIDIKNILGQGCNCYIGISTRTIRMVASDRLLKEAEEALVHAQENPEDPIIAFRANAEKYRQFLEKNNN